MRSRRNVETLSKEFKQYNPEDLCEKYVYEVMGLDYQKATPEKERVLSY